LTVNVINAVGEAWTSRSVAVATARNAPAEGYRAIQEVPGIEPALAAMSVVEIGERTPFRRSRTSSAGGPV
jgi:hypothetical protein